MSKCQPIGPLIRSLIRIYTEGFLLLNRRIHREPEACVKMEEYRKNGLTLEGQISDV